ncbi:MAG TPA: ribbon-helix-helix domain-containing protein [Candidatus Acidoferrales bacterium]|nr:ribbon-helix-helix domain-containing protein [Candidatus Acidoferrales bacterium]
MAYTRTNIYLTQPEMKALEKESKALGISMAELIRRILDKHIAQQGKQ